MRNVVTTPRVLATVPSKSNPAKSYEIRLGGDGVVYCTCRAWIQNKFCKHLEEYHTNMQQLQPMSKSNIQAKANSLAAQAGGSDPVLQFFQDQITGHKYLSSDKNGMICAICGCSQKAIVNFNWNCTRSPIEAIVKHGIIEGRWL